MSKFLVSYQGGMPADAVAARASRQRWEEWLATLKGTLVDAGGPAKSGVYLSSPVTETASTLSGYSIVEATDLEAAKKLLSNCPIYSEGGSATMAKLMELPSAR